MSSPDIRPGLGQVITEKSRSVLLEAPTYAQNLQQELHNWIKEDWQFKAIITALLGALVIVSPPEAKSRLMVALPVGGLLGLGGAMIAACFNTKESHE